MGRHGLHKAHSKAWEKHHEMPVRGVRSLHQMDRLMKKLKGTTSISNRLQYLVYEMKVSPQVFSGEQVLALAHFFPGANLVLALHLFDHHLLGFKCEQAAQLISMIQVPEQRLEALQVIDENLLDPVNRFSLRNIFPPYLLSQVDTVLNEVKGQSFIYGSMRSTHVIFLVDKSGSMETEFTTDCGEDFNRLEFVVHDLHKLIHHRVNPNFCFNMISFNSSIHKWKHSLHPATPLNLKDAEHWLDNLEAGGGTNFSDPLRAALLDEDVDTIYLLSDGEPNEDTRDIIFNLKNWVQQRKNPVTINTIAFLMGHYTNDPIPRTFLLKIAEIGGGVFRCLDPFHLDSEHIEDGYDDDISFENDDDFVKFFNNKLSDVPQSLLDRCELIGYNRSPPMMMQPGLPPIPMSQNPLPLSNPALPGPQIVMPPTPDFLSFLKRRPRSQEEISITSFTQEPKHVVYNVQVSLKQVAPNKDCSWVVSHRYDDFKTFHHTITDKLKSANIGTLSSLNFPPAHLHILAHDRAFLEKRRIDLERYLKSLYLYVSPYEFPEFDNFLLLDLHVSQVIEQATIEMKTSMMYFQPPPFFQGFNPGQPLMNPGQPLVSSSPAIMPSMQPQGFNPGQPLMNPGQPLVSSSPAIMPSMQPQGFNPGQPLMNPGQPLVSSSPAIMPSMQPQGFNPGQPLMNPGQPLVSSNPTIIPPMQAINNVGYQQPPPMMGQPSLPIVSSSSTGYPNQNPQQSNYTSYTQSSAGYNQPSVQPSYYPQQNTSTIGSSSGNSVDNPTYPDNTTPTPNQVSLEPSAPPS